MTHLKRLLCWRCNRSILPIVGLGFYRCPTCGAIVFSSRTKESLDEVRVLIDQYGRIKGPPQQF